MMIRNTISGDSYEITQVAVVGRESDEAIELYGSDLESDEWELVDE